MPATAALYSAAPQIAVDGEPSALLEALLVQLVVEERLDQITSCEATFHNVGMQHGSIGYQLFDTNLLDFGHRLSFAAGQGDRAGTLFTGRVTALRAEYPASGTPMLVVLAEDRLQDFRMTRRTRTFADLTDAEIVELVATGHGLQAEVSLEGPMHRVIAQVDQSDLAFLRHRVATADAELWVDGDTLRVAPRADRRGRAVTLSFRQNLREASLTADLAHQRTKLSVAGWDVSAKAAIEVEATDQVLAGERRGGRSGAQLLAERFGERVDRVVHTAPASTAEAQNVADAYFRALARRFVTGQAITEGDARLRVGSPVSLTGLGAWFSGTYDVVGVQHLFDLGEGFRTVVSLERGELDR